MLGMLQHQGSWGQELYKVISHTHLRQTETLQFLVQEKKQTHTPLTPREKKKTLKMATALGCRQHFTGPLSQES